jgi:hypothetical protein
MMQNNQYNFNLVVICNITMSDNISVAIEILYKYCAALHLYLYPVPRFLLIKMFKITSFKKNL